MNTVNNYLIGLIILIFFSCSSVKLKNGASNFNPSKKIENVKIFAKNEKAPHNGKRVGEFVMREDWNTDWTNLKSKLEDFAKAKGGNILEINTLGWGKKGNGFYAEGTLFYVENVKEVTPKPQEGCGIYIIRDGSESLIGSAFSIDIKIDDTDFNNLTKNTIIKKEFPVCNHTAKVSINGKNYKIELSGESRYFKVNKQTSGFANGAGIAIGLGGVSFIEIKNKELGRLLAFQMQQ